MKKYKKNGLLFNIRKICPSQNRSQVGVEYMIVIGFVTFAIISVITLAIFYSGEIKDRLRLTQVENFATQLINSVDSIFFAGEPSKTTVKLYLPEGVESINITQDYYLLITTRVSGGENKRVFESKVPMQGAISPGEGIKKLTLEARSNNVLISQV